MSLVFAILLWALGLFLLLATVLPFSKIAHGVVRGLDFPRQQFLLVALLCLLGFALGQGGRLGWLGSVAMLVVVVLQAGLIAKFTPFWKHQSVSASDARRADAAGRITVLAANVKKSNRDYDRLVSLIGERQPDVVMAIEVDAPWIAALKSALEDDFGQWVEVPMDNGYGLCLMSRLPLQDVQVRELVTEGVPSIRARLSLRNGEDLRLYVVHPEPPVIDHDTKGRDSEIALIGIEAAEDTLPAIVSGDLNDVAWSTTTRRFQRLSGLCDPRVGRGFYNTFSATMPLMRWPLDHLFHDPRFRLVEMARLRKIGSDHFPMWFDLALAAQEAVGTDPGEASSSEEHAARQMIQQEKKRDREAIGSDWEDE